jgi:methyl-accepting chemotaxis protein
MKSFKDLRITYKTILPLLCSYCIVIIALLFYVLPQLREAILERKKETLVNINEIALTTLSGFDKQVKSGKISLEQAQSSAKSIIKSMRFEGKNYYFVFDKDKMLIQPVSPEREGKPLSFFKDDHKIEYLTQAAELCQKEGKGYVFYYKAKPKTTEPLPKISYFKTYEPWGWIIGAGVYFDDIEAEYASIRNKIVYLFGIIMLALLAGLYFINRIYIAVPIRKLTESAKIFSDGDISSDFNIVRDDEIGELAKSFDMLKQNIMKMLQETDTSVQLASMGQLTYRSDPNTCAGAFRDALNAFNYTLDEIVTPLNKTGEYLKRISKGDIPDEISDDFQGDFIEIRDSVELCVRSIDNLIKDIQILIDKVMLGDLNYRINHRSHSGAYSDIALGVNMLMDRMCGMFDEIPAPLNIVDLQKRIIYSNKKSKELFKLNY